MKSKWYHLKTEAIKLRKQGQSIAYVEKTLGIPRSTLSGWFKDVPLTNAQKKKLHKNWENALVKARKEAVKWHNARKRERIDLARSSALETLNKINLMDNSTLELSLALLYLGEGSKKKVETSLASSDPEILRFYIAALKRLYDVETCVLSCQLYLRADQNPNDMRRYWSKTLRIPLSQFRYTNLDKRTQGRPTYTDYKGVCSVMGGGVAIQRKLVYLANAYIKQIGGPKTSG